MPSPQASWVPKLGRLPHIDPGSIPSLRTCTGLEWVHIKGGESLAFARQMWSKHKPRSSESRDPRPRADFFPSRIRTKAHHRPRMSGSAGNPRCVIPGPTREPYPSYDLCQFGTWVLSGTNKAFRNAPSEEHDDNR